MGWVIWGGGVGVKSSVVIVIGDCAPTPLGLLITGLPNLVCLLSGPTEALIGGRGQGEVKGQLNRSKVKNGF